MLWYALQGKLSMSPLNLIHWFPYKVQVQLPIIDCNKLEKDFKIAT